MMLADAIDSAVSEHAVYFLVTAYLESLHHFHTSLGIPEHVVALPLSGMDDLIERTQTLRNIGAAPIEGRVGVAEAKAILECAVARLREIPHVSGSTIGDTRGLKQAAA